MGINFAFVSMIFILDFETSDSMEKKCLFFILLHISRQNSK